jgi:hypothetical protein
VEKDSLEDDGEAIGIPARADIEGGLPGGPGEGSGPIAGDGEIRYGDHYSWDPMGIWREWQ